MEPSDLAPLTWRKSSYSGTQENCVEVARTTTSAAVRDSKDPDGPMLVLPPRPFDAFLRSLDLTWRTSSFTSGENCVEVAREANFAAVRDSKDRQGPALVIPAAAFNRFLDGLK